MTDAPSQSPRTTAPEHDSPWRVAETSPPRAHAPTNKNSHANLYILCFYVRLLCVTGAFFFVVLAQVTFSDLARHDEHLAVQAAAAPFARGSGVSAARFERLEDKVSELVAKLDYLSHHVEHELAAVGDHNKV